MIYFLLTDIILRKYHAELGDKFMFDTEVNCFA